MQPMSFSIIPFVMLHLHQQLKFSTTPIIKTSITLAMQFNILAIWWQSFDHNKEGQKTHVDIQTLCRG